eukprot:scaffold100700_cov15-Tisochrysis_lutea.AAC.1
MLWCTHRESVNRLNSHVSRKAPSGAGNSAPSPSGQGPYSRAGTSGSNGADGTGEGANALSPGRQGPYSRAGTGGSNGAGGADQ